MSRTLRQTFDDDAGVLGALASDRAARRASPRGRPRREAGAVAFLIYRGNPRCGGQGVYTRHLTRELVALGHSVEVFSGPAVARARRGRRASRRCAASTSTATPTRSGSPRPREFTSLADVAEFAVDAAPAGSASRSRTPGGSAKVLAARRGDFDIVHDNQCLGSGILELHRDGLAAARDAAPPDHRRPLDRARPRRGRAWKRYTTRRWFGFLRMQVRVARAAARGAHGLAQLARPTSTRQMRRARSSGSPSCRSAWTTPCSAPTTTSSSGPGGSWSRPRQRRAHEGPRAAARGGGQAARRARHRADRDRQAPAQGPRRARRSSGSGSSDIVTTIIGRQRRGARPPLRRGRGRGRARASTRGSRCRRSRR